MDIKERLSFFQEMVQCEYPLHLWHYSPEFELIETDCPAELMLPDIISMLGFSSLVLAHIESGNRMPLILDTEFGLCAAADPHRRSCFYRKQLTSGSA